MNRHDVEHIVRVMRRLCEANGWPSDGPVFWTRVCDALEMIEELTRIVYYQQRRNERQTFAANYRNN